MMSSVLMEDVDFIEELRLRRWARQHYVEPEHRDESWHPIIHEEMERRDAEADEPVPNAVAVCTER